MWDWEIICGANYNVEAYPSFPENSSVISSAALSLPAFSFLGDRL